VIRVLIFAPSLTDGAGLERLLPAREVKIVARTSEIEGLPDLFADTEPDVVVIDASNEGSDETLEAIVDSGIVSDAAVVAILDNESITAKSAEALRKGVRAVLPSDITPDQLVAALRAATAGLVVLHPVEVTATFSTQATSSQALDELTEPLTPREREVLQMLASGLGNKQIAARLNISEHTAKFHVASILGKLGAGSRTEAVAVGIRRGLVLL
jgi:two-component system, NarL family, response regulator YdfI